MMNLLSDQVSELEIHILLRELSAVLDRNVGGDVVEFGCYIGTASVFLAKALARSGRQLYLYDSFVGLPEKTIEDASPAGLQFKAGELLATKKQLIRNLKKASVVTPKIKKAWFKELVPSDLPDKIAFAFLDGDYYQSIMDSLELVWPKLSHAAAVVIDDYSNPALPGASLAVDRWLKDHSASLRVEESLAILRV